MNRTTKGIGVLLAAASGAFPACSGSGESDTSTRASGSGPSTSSTTSSAGGAGGGTTAASSSAGGGSTTSSSAGGSTTSSSTGTTAASSSSAGGGSATSSSSGTTAASSGAGGSGSTTSSSGTGGAPACQPGATVVCYTGPPQTEGVGVCHSGIATCKFDGTGFGNCVGEVTPAPETCNSLADEDCDGLVNEEGPDCVCVPGTVSSCYSGPTGTINVGACKPGTRVCDADGLGYGPCTGEITPAPETCNTAVDDDCDGLVNEEGPGCVCVPGSITTCYTGPALTRGVGMCHDGTMACNALGMAYGPCTGEILPAPENCQSPEDEDCDGFGICCGNGKLDPGEACDTAIASGPGSCPASCGDGQP
jgi:hypothetical protein